MLFSLMLLKKKIPNSTDLGLNCIQPYQPKLARILAIKQLSLSLYSLPVSFLIQCEHCKNALTAIYSHRIHLFLFGTTESGG